MTNYDKLILEVWTDGSVLPEDAIAYSAKIIKDQISVFISFDERISGESGGEGGGSADINDNLFKGIDELELSDQLSAQRQYRHCRRAGAAARSRNAEDEELWEEVP